MMPMTDYIQMVHIIGLKENASTIPIHMEPDVLYQVQLLQT